MNHIRPTVLVLMLLLALLTACAPKAAPTPMVIVVTATSEATEAPAATEAPVEEPTATLEPINLIPPMEVGSTFIYVDGSILVAMPGGEFIMGRAGSTDNPERKVNVGDVWAYRYKVTNRQYALCVATGECSKPDLNDNITYNDALHSNDPVNGVTWAQAESYCSFVHGRLPTEAEWEKLARGPDGNIYPWGDGAPACDLLNFNNCVGKATAVSTYPQGKSYYEAYDMQGNLHEWVADFYDALYTRDGPTDNPLGPETGNKRSVRSTSYKSKSDQVPSSVRFFTDPGDHRRDLGFRCVVEDPGYFAPICEQALIFGYDVPSDGSSGSIPKICPTIDISETGRFCGPDYTPQTNMSVVISPSSWPMSPPSVPASCTGGPPLYTCVPPGGSISASAECEYGDPDSVSCPPGYDQVGNICSADGYPGPCLPGFTYDPDKQCCTSGPGAGASFGLCTGDTWYADPPGACMPFEAAGPISAGPVGIPFKTCEPSHPGGGCDPQTDPNCQPGQPGGGCPTWCQLSPNGRCICP